MRLLLLSWLTVSSVLAYDAVVFSNEQKISKEFPSAENLMSTASPDAPLVYFVNPDFALGQFSRHASVYSADKKASGLAEIVKSSKSHAARFLDNGIHAPDAVVVTSADEFKSGSAVYIIAGDDWTSMESLAEKILPQVGSKYTAVITSTDAVSKDKTRVKRLTIEGIESDSAAVGTGALVYGPSDMPLVIPPFNLTDKVTPDLTTGDCLFYSEGLNIVVMAKPQGKPATFAAIDIRPENGTKWSYYDGDVSCQAGNISVGDFVFTMRLTTGNELRGQFGGQDVIKLAASSNVSFTFTIRGDNMGYWNLVNVTSAGTFTITSLGGSSGFGMDGDATLDVGAKPGPVEYMGLGSIVGWAYGCSTSQAVFFNTTKDTVKIGVSLYNTEIQTTGVVARTKDATSGRTKVSFTLNVDDCTGTFSTGSWMAIISILVMLSGFIFGYLMLNSVQTMDRFDDPKQKQILINVRE